jgi:lysophospholipase L1-like esterase
MLPHNKKAIAWVEGLKENMSMDTVHCRTQGKNGVSLDLTAARALASGRQKLPRCASPPSSGCAGFEGHH